MIGCLDSDGGAARETAKRSETNRSPFGSPLTVRQALDQPGPAVRFAVEGLVGEGFVNLLYGDGGTGKTLLGLHVAVAVAAGIPLFDRRTRQMPALVVLAEDGYGATTERLRSIMASLDVDESQLPLKIWCVPGDDVALASIDDDGSVHERPFFAELKAQLEEIGPCFVMLDTVTDFARLDENKRAPVNALCKQVLGGLCRDHGATLLVTAHPSKAAMISGANYAGSTAWNNAVRFRLELTADGNRRMLTLAKSNYAPPVELILQLSGLCFTGGTRQAKAKAELFEAVLDFVLEQLDAGRTVVRASGNGLKPKDVSDELNRRGLRISRQEVGDALSALEIQGRLVYEPGGNKVRGQRAGFRRP